MIRLRPMDSHRLTPASRIMLPTYPLAYMGIGLSLIAQDPVRTSSRLYDIVTLGDAIPVVIWGVLFLTVGVAEACAYLTDDGRGYIRVLTLASGLAAFWAAAITIAVFKFDTLSFSMIGWLVIAVAAHAASARSIAHDYLQGRPE